MADIFQEVDEALQKDKLEKLWKDYGLVIIGAIVMLVLGTAASVAWQAWSVQHNQKETAKLLRALQAPQPLPALEQAAQNMRGGQAALADLTRASMMLQEGGYAQAAEVYKSLFENGKAPDALEDLARILYVRATLSDESTAPDSAALLSVLQPVQENENSPYQLQSYFDSAMIKGTLEQDHDAALAFLDKIADHETADPGLKDKAAQLAIYFKNTKSQPSEKNEPTQ